ncbi:MAG TPA: tryptophan synthase subunit alpha [Candidatus Egerieimonas intestinavium]|uniref:Tryptophan synthase alpha chain n=1 Tax=Candidatus Egerieimonas intestinavium TaxID=2840777 RepID=A0A9D1EMP7_9FIRM|nr:tryptophan synthase subunit alpha [Candidatus Egerieimonas intestinavium]
MNNRIQQAFARGKAFIPFITGGDPDLETTGELVREMEAAGADIIEIGIPFSDPIAEGPVIQAASERALQGGTTVDKLFDLVEELRKTVKIPLLFMGYANSVFGYGAEKFFEKCSQVGVDGLILPDIPFEEKDEFQDLSEKYQVTLISMVAPTSSQRARAIAREAQGFLYCVSSLGVTGVREELHQQISDIVKQAKEVSEVPCAIGFGISTPQQAREMAGFADGVIVGSAIVKLVEAKGRDCVPEVRAYVGKMKEALKGFM